MASVQTHDRLVLCCLTAEQRKQTCDYWYTVRSDGGALPHTAFRTRAALLMWLGMRRLKVRGDVPAEGEWAVFFIEGSYRTAMHMDGTDFYAVAVKGADWIRTLSNGEYTLGLISTDDDGLRTVHTLNPNVKDRRRYEYRESAALHDQGEPQ